MSNSWFLARRLLLWRQEKRRLNWSALISVIGVALGSLVLVLSLSILNGFETDVRGSLQRFKHHAVLLPQPSGADVEHAKALLDAAGFDAQLYAERKIAILFNEDYRLVTARIVPDLAARQEILGDAILQQIIIPSLGPEIIVGSLLADRLGLLPGDKVYLISPLDVSLSNPTPPRLEATVRAIYEFGILDFDDSYMFIDFEAAEKLVPQLTAYSGLSLEPGVKNARISTDLLGEEWILRTWETDHADLLTAMRLEKLGSTVVLFLIILVASFNATSTMVMSVMEKYREIGILRSMGATRRFVKHIFVRQGLLIGLVGVSLGAGIGVAIALAQEIYHFIPGPEGLYVGSTLPLSLHWPDVLVVVIGSLTISLGAAWYPARYASSIEPAQAVNYEK